MRIPVFSDKEAYHIATDEVSDLFAKWWQGYGAKCELSLIEYQLKHIIHTTCSGLCLSVEFEETLYWDTLEDYGMHLCAIEYGDVPDWR